ncbi:MAG: hypothetical protein GX436_07625, partial [Synergistaceae bacterium]|nr:hypothetical protein [Synergistaceae bacterium]
DRHPRDGFSALGDLPADEIFELLLHFFTDGRQLDPVSIDEPPAPFLRADRVEEQHLGLRLAVGVMNRVIDAPLLSSLPSMATTTRFMIFPSGHLARCLVDKKKKPDRNNIRRDITLLNLLFKKETNKLRFRKKEKKYCALRSYPI